MQFKGLNMRSKIPTFFFRRTLQFAENKILKKPKRSLLKWIKRYQVQLRFILIPSFVCQVQLRFILIPSFVCQVQLRFILIPSFVCQVQLRFILIPSFVCQVQLRFILIPSFVCQCLKSFTALKFLSFVPLLELVVLMTNLQKNLLSAG